MEGVSWRRPHPCTVQAGGREQNDRQGLPLLPPLCVAAPTAAVVHSGREIAGDDDKLSAPSSSWRGEAPSVPREMRAGQCSAPSPWPPRHF